jgi:dUTPase
MTSVYLAGPLDYAKLGPMVSWREKLVEHVQKELGNSSPLFFSPNKPFDNALNDVTALVNINMAAVSACRILVACVVPTQPSWGTPIEVYEARRQGKHVLLWLPEGVDDCPAYLKNGTYKSRNISEIAGQIVSLINGLDNGGIASTSEDILYENGGVQYPKMSGDVGYDIQVMENFAILPYEHARIPIGINGQPLRVKSPKNTWFSMHIRSSMAAKGLMANGTVIDEGYTGDVFMFVFNASKETVHLKSGMRIGQIVFYPSIVRQLRMVDQLPNTARGIQDLEKLNSARVLGWVVFQYTKDMILKDPIKCVEQVKIVIERRLKGRC